MDELSLQTIECYNQIAESFSKTRCTLKWKATLKFVSELPSTPFSILDVGCGNGELLRVIQEKFPESVRFGCDASRSLLNIAETKSDSTFFEHVLPNQIEINQKLDFVTCIAVLGHILTQEDRLQSLKVLLDVLSPNGILFMIVWSNEESNIKKKYEKLSDQLYKIPFYDRFGSKKDQNRYYYLFRENEIEELLEKLTMVLPYKIRLLDTYHEEGNYCFTIQKLV